MNVAWRNEKLSRFYSSRLKLSQPNFDKVGTLYQFDCPGCRHSYVGETKKRLSSRISEHANPNHGSAITKHVYKCKKYTDKLDQKFPNSNNEEKAIFISDHFSLIQSNLSNYNIRKVVEAIEIKLKKPFLNNQVYHRAITFF